MPSITMSTGHRLVDLRREFARIPSVSPTDAARMVATINRAVAKCPPAHVVRSRRVALPPPVTVAAALTGMR